MNYKKRRGIFLKYLTPSLTPSLFYYYFHYRTIIIIKKREGVEGVEGVILKKIEIKLFKKNNLKMKSKTNKKKKIPLLPLLFFKIHIKKPLICLHRFIHRYFFK